MAEHTGSSVLASDVLEARLAEVAQAQQRGRQESLRLQAALTENIAQMNILRGRHAELTELLALPEAPAGDVT